jgi:hypothetical protein
MWRPWFLNKLNKNCITLVSLYWYIMMHGQKILRLKCRVWTLSIVVQYTVVWNAFVQHAVVQYYVVQYTVVQHAVVQICLAVYGTLYVDFWQSCWELHSSYVHALITGISHLRLRYSPREASRLVSLRVMIETESIFKTYVSLVFIVGYYEYLYLHFQLLFAVIFISRKLFSKSILLSSSNQTFFAVSQKY